MGKDRLVWATISTFFIWMSVGIITIAIPTLTVFAGVMAFFSMMVLWLGMAFAQFTHTEEGSIPDKAKRGATGGDARLALLLELMEEDERQALKKRLLDNLSADGEAVSLADLLTIQNGQSREHR
jgi:hypothetical protein